MEYSFLPELVQRLSRNTAQSILELVQNSYDADATRVLVTFLPDGLAVEDDAGMNGEQIRSFHTVGGMHEDEEFTPSGRRVVGKYRFGRLLVLGVYECMEVRTRSDPFADSTKLTFEDLYALSQGSVTTPKLDEPFLKRPRGSEFLMSGRKADVDYEECAKLLMQQPFLRTPGFEVYAKKAGSFSEWDFGGAERVYPRDIPGMKLPVKIERAPGPSGTGGSLKVEGVITIADDAALPLAEEDKGIGIVVSGLLVTRTYFGFEASQHRLDRVTGYVESNNLKTTYGTKDRLIEDENYKHFIVEMRTFFECVVIPKLREAEIRLVGRTEMKLLRRVDRVLGKVLAQSQPGLFPEGRSISPMALKLLVPEGSILEQGKESSVVIVVTEEKTIEPEKRHEPVSEPPQQAERQGILQAASVASGEPSEAAAPAQDDRAQPAITVQTDQPSQPPQAAAQQPPDQPVIAPEERAGPKRVAHYLHDVGIVVMFYDDAADERPSYSDPGFTLQGVPAKAVFVNKKHPSYKRSETKNDIPQHLIRLITNEIIAMGYRESGEAIRAANRLYGLAASEL
jgi:hypothetical protein